MFTYAILLWILINLSAPTWCYVLLCISTFTTILKWGMNLTKSS